LFRSETGSHYVAQAGLELLILLLLPRKCWNCRHMLPYPSWCQCFTASFNQEEIQFSQILSRRQDQMGKTFTE
jgi:hypothetical protein